MHNIEPYYSWREKYIASEDERSPFYGREYSEFQYSKKIYNYFIHPQWDHFGSQTLYLKILFADYDKEFAILELIGEWNDTLHNDIMFLKREVIDPLIEQGIYKYVLICENVLNFHADDNCYYEEWWDDVKEEGGWISMLNIHSHVEDELGDAQINYYVNFGSPFNEVNWRPLKPNLIVEAIELQIFNQAKSLW